MKNLSILELFILSSIDRGHSTPYLMQRAAGLSLGATSPTLPKLAKNGLIRRENSRTATNRPRHEYTLTPAGKEQVRQGWNAYLQPDATPPADLDSLLRLIDMGSYHAVEPARLANLAKRAAILRRKMAKSCLLEASVATSKNASAFLNTRTKLDALRYEAEAVGLSRLASDLAKKSPSRRSKTVS